MQVGAVGKVSVLVVSVEKPPLIMSPATGVHSSVKVYHVVPKYAKMN